MSEETKTEPFDVRGEHACRERLSELLRGLKVPPSHFWAHCPPAAMFALGSVIADQAEECQALRAALERVKLEAVSLADAQVIALEALPVCRDLLVAKTP